MSNVVRMVPGETVAADRIKLIVERVERLHEERKSIADMVKDIYAEAKADGFSVPALKHVVKLRGQDAAERAEFDAIVDLYLTALGSHVHVREAAE